MWSISLVPIILSVVLACWSLLRKALVPLIMTCLEGPVAPQCMTDALTTYKLNRPFFLFPRIKYSTVALAYAVSEYLLNTIVREEKKVYRWVIASVVSMPALLFVKWCFVVPTLVNWKWVAVYCWELNYFCCPGLYVACISSPILLQYTFMKSIWCSIDER